MPESVFCVPEKMASLKEKPNLSFKSLYLFQISLVKYLLSSDLVPSGNIGNPVKSVATLS
jgi:hypothetical protein